MKIDRFLFQLFLDEKTMGCYALTVEEMGNNFMKVTFQSVTEIVLNLVIENDTTQMDFMFDLFASFCDFDSEFNMDNGQIHHWLKGNQKVSPKIVNYYNGKDKHELMASDLEAHVFPYIADIGLLGSKLEDLVLSDVSISSVQKDILLGFKDFSSKAGIARFTSEVLIFGFSRPFDKKDSSKETSPALADMIIMTANPKPVSTFVGRTKELKNLDELLSSDKHIFVGGIPGIGKSEFAKQYAKLHKKDYTNILYLVYDGSLYNLIADLDFIDDTEDLTDKDRFRKHFRFLKTLKEDSLIIIDNFDTTASADGMFATFNGLKCKILYTTRSHFEGQEELILESNKELATEIFKVNSSNDYSFEDIDAILETIDYHVMTSELLGRLIAYSKFTPSELKIQLKDNVLLKAEHQNVKLSKDNSPSKMDFQSHLLNLLRFDDLEDNKKHLLALLALGPESGFSLFYLRSWYGECINELQDLEEEGLLEIKQFIVKLHPYIRKIINSEQYLNFSKLTDFFKNIDFALSDDTNNSSLLALEIIQNSCKYLIIDNTKEWTYFIAHSIECSKQRKQYSTFKYLLAYYKEFLGGVSNMAALEQGLYEHYLAANFALIDQDYNSAIKHELKAIDIYEINFIRDTRYLATSYMDVANYYLHQNNLDSAKSYTALGVDVVKHNKLEYSVIGASCYSQYGKLLCQEGKYSEALGYYTKCIEVMKTIKLDSGLAYAYSIQNLAAIQAGNRQYDAALNNYSQALKLFTNLLDAEDSTIEFCKNQISEITRKKALSSLH